MINNLITQEEIDSFLNEYGQEPTEIKNCLEEIYDFEIKVDDEFIINTGNYFFSESHNLWITINSESSKQVVFDYLNLLHKGESVSHYVIV